MARLGRLSGKSWSVSDDFYDKSALVLIYWASQKVKDDF
jgi:hypothetical protein